MPTQQVDVIKCAGLVTQYNPLGYNPYALPNGALLQADDCNIRREDTIENRRGYRQYGSLGSTPTQTLTYNSSVLFHNGSNLSFSDGGSPTGNFYSYNGAFSAPANQTMRFAQANSNVYFTTSKGPYVAMDTVIPFTVTGVVANGSNQVTNVAPTGGVLVGYAVSCTGFPAGVTVAQFSGSTITMSQNATASSTTHLTLTPNPRAMGAPRALGMDYAVTGNSGFLPSGFQCAYRSLIQRVDENQNTIFGYPSDRMWTINTDSSKASRNISVTGYLTSDTQAGDTIQFYRTLQQSGTSSDTAGDEEALCYQKVLAQSDITRGSFIFTDNLIDGLLTGATIYTAPSQGGIQVANAKPPLCNDIALFKNFMFFANTQTAQILYFTMVSATGQYNGGSYGGTLTLAGVTYSAGATQVIQSGQYQVYNSGVVATDIANTAKSLVKVINQYTANTSVYAFYISGPNDLPGQIRIEARNVGIAAFTLQASDILTGSDFSPSLPVSPVTSLALTSSNSVQQNALYYSNFQQFEGVPLLNSLLIGSANNPILRIAPLRDSLIIIKKNEGIYRLTGEDAQSFTVYPLDLTVFCKAINSVAVLANQVFMLSNQGVVSVSDIGVNVVSHQIEPNILPLLGFSNLDSNTYGIAYESDRTYLLSTIDAASDTAPTQTFVYNTFTQAWSRYTFAFTSGAVDPATDKLFFTQASSKNVYVERKDFASTDYSDPEYQATINTISGANVNFTLTAVTPATGWVLSQGGTNLKIESITQNGASWDAVMSYAPPTGWTTTVATVYPAINMAIEWVPFTANQSGSLKQLQQVEALTDLIGTNSSISNLTITMRTDFDRNTDTVVINSNATGWGGPWSTLGWGGQSETFSYRTWPTKSKSYFRALSCGVRHANALEKASVNGISYTFSSVSERTAR